MKWNYSIMVGYILTGLTAQVATGAIGGNCGTTGVTMGCGAGPTCSMWNNTSYGIFYNCGAPTPCSPDGTSPTGYSQTFPTYIQMYTYSGCNTCLPGNICDCDTQIPGITGPCAASPGCTVQCTPSSTCTGFSPWANGAYGAPGCPAGQRQQTRTDTPLGCSPATAGPFSQCVPDASCSLPIIPSCSASPSSIFAGDPATLSWTTSGATLVSIDQGVGPVAASGSQIVTPPLTVTYTVTATNANGSATCPITLTVSPSPPRCPVGSICGDLHAAEVNTLAIPTWPIELRTAAGDRLSMTFTDATGHFSFTGLGAGPYSVYTTTQRLTSTWPSQKFLSPHNIITDGSALILGVPAKLIVTGPINTFVLITTFTWTAATPPTINQDDIVHCSFAVTRVIDNIQPPKPIELRGGFPYFYTCWKPQSVGQAQFAYVKGASQPVNGGVTVWPLDQLSEVCP